MSSDDVTAERMTEAVAAIERGKKDVRAVGCINREDTPPFVQVVLCKYSAGLQAAARSRLRTASFGHKTDDEPRPPQRLRCRRSIAA